MSIDLLSALAILLMAIFIICMIYRETKLAYKKEQKEYENSP